jgi:small subunit ribosomal protein S17
MMAEENEKSQDTEQPAEETAPEEPKAEETAPEEPKAEEPDAGEDQPAEDQPPAEEEGGEEAPAEEEEEATAAEAEDSPHDEEDLSPKQRRRLERSRAGGPPGPQRSPEERAAQRLERRRHAGQQRGRHRRRRRERQGEPGAGTPPAQRAPGKRKVRLGKVVSSGAEKTITVRIERARRDTTYEKVVRRSSTVHAHDERNEASEGDMVRVVETRPLSRTKRWRLLEIVERAR